MVIQPIEAFPPATPSHPHRATKHENGDNECGDRDEPYRAKVCPPGDGVHFIKGSDARWVGHSPLQGSGTRDLLQSARFRADYSAVFF
jgi:hypothetical protein